jgi:nicotinamide mononucleotide adenylyltransferase
MIRESFLDRGLSMNNVSIVPFHIFHLPKWQCYLPPARHTTQYVRAFSEWEDKKIESFRRFGFSVEVLDWRAPKGIEATAVRELMRSGKHWQDKVPEGTARVIRKVEAGLL